MRSFLIRHFFKIYLKFNLRRTTLHLAVHLMDLYFWRKQQEEIADQLQTVALGQTCLFIAMKYEEIYPPQLASWLDLRHLRSIIKLEAEVLKVLEFQLGHYTLEHFLQMRLWEAGR
jgi:Cyclin, N-terminal domain